MTKRSRPSSSDRAKSAAPGKAPARTSAGRPPASAKAGAARAAALKAYCRSLPGVTEDVKWEDHLCFSVGGKMFAIFDVAAAPYASFKVDDIEFERLTTRPGIIPAPYAARFSWIRVDDVASLPAAQMKSLLARSRELIIEKLPAKARRVLQPPT